MKKTLKEFQQIPGIGKVISKDLYDLGYRSIKDLIDANPENMHIRLCQLKRQDIDRCMLYTFRCAVYYVNNTTHNPELLKWWNWKHKDEDIAVFKKNNSKSCKKFV